MIYCPQCGTANKPNSKFCKNCAALLAPSTDVRCPICGTMNPSGAATCSNCDTRLTTTSATPSDRTTPADTPENITPYTPPEMAQEDSESESASPPPSTARPSFGRSSSEWLRRVQKTPPPEAAANNTGTAAAASIAAASAEDATHVTPASTSAQAPSGTDDNDIPEWLREIQNEANQQAAAEAAAETAVVRDDSADSNSHVAAAAAAGIVAADQIFGPPSTDALKNATVGQVETLAAAKPQLSEIKLTGDDYDYSDIGGEVTPEMQAALEANAANLTSVDDETALARKLLGLDVEDTPVIATERDAPNLAPLAVGAVAAQALSQDEPLASIETPVARTESPAVSTEIPVATQAIAESAPEPAQVIETPAAQEEDRSHVPGVVAGVAAMGAAASKMFSGEEQPPPTAPAPPVTAKPQLSEIKLTGDDYDYSDIGGEVTPEMQAALEANAANLTSVDDETALARKLLGLDVEDTPVIATERDAPNLAPLAAGAVAVEGLSAQPPADTNVVVENAQAPAQEEDGLSLAKAVAGVAAVGTVAAAVLDKDEDVPALKPAEQIDETMTTASLESETLAPVGAAAVAAGETSPVVVDETPVPGQTEADVPAAETAVIVEQTNAEIGENDRSPAWVTALAAASSAAVVAAVVSDKPDDDAAQQATQQEDESEMPPALAVGATAAALDAASDSAPVSPTAPPLQTGEMPEWLREIAPEDIAGVKPLTPDEQGALPAWVQELAPTAAALGTVAYLSQLPDLDEEERGDLPEWLREPVAPTPESVAAVAAADQAEALGQEPPLELPSWFADPAVTGAVRDPFEVVEMTGPLAGISGILPLALAITEPHTLTTPAPARSDGGRIFQTLLAEPLASAGRTETAEKSKGLFNTNHLLYLLIFVAALVPLFFGLEQAGLGLDATTSGTALFYDELQSIPTNGTALLAFEYTPGGAVELDPAARAIVNDLAARRVSVIALTSNPNGATLAQSVLERAAETHPEFTYVNVGYIPGNEAGLRALAGGWLPASREDVNGVAWGSTPLAGTVRNMDELAMTVLIVGDDTSLRTWMEQVQPRITSPIIAATSALLEPQARNYVNAQQLQASLRGLTGAAELELLSNQTGQAVKTMDSFSVISLVIAGIIIVANVMLLLRRKK